jgi:sugar/nucleoside kinase (ribokinase family)
MSLLVTGSIGIDTVKTPYGISENCLGGSSIYFSMAASFFSPVRLVGVIGADCPFDLAKIFAGRNVDLAGLEVRPQSKTFRWAGSYHDNMDDRKTDSMELNVLAEHPPTVPESFRDSRFVFLANTTPKLQLELLDQLESPLFVAADTMNCWIQNHLTDLKTLLKRIDCLIINEDEAKMLAAEFNLIKAADKILGMGPGVIIIKKGESGSITCDAKGHKFVLPAYPAAEVTDPTGAGDSFAGATLGYLAQTGKTDFQTLKTAVAYGTVAASFTIADFSLHGLTSITRNDIDKRLETLRKLTHF